MVTQVYYTIFMGLIALERIAELFVARRNAALSFAKGAKEFGKEHYPYMVLLHLFLLFGCVVEVWFFDRSFSPIVGALSLSLAVFCQALRWWVIYTLGFMWNTRVIVVPGCARISHGPFRWLKHPNYVAVVIEGIVLPLGHGAWFTALVFTIANAVLLTIRIRCEEKALSSNLHARNEG